MRKKTVCNLFLAFIIVLGLASCKKEENTMIMVKVINSGGNSVVGATVRVYCTEPGCIIDNTQTTDAFGQSYHNFELEAVLAINAYKVIPPDTLYGTGIADVVSGEIVKTIVTIK